MTIQKNPLESDGRAAEVFRTAAQIILQKGYDATSVSDIANALGITKAGLYHYIRTKTELLFDIMNFGMDELEREVVHAAKLIADPEARLRFIITNNACIVTRGDGAVTIVVDEARALTPAQHRKITKRKRAYFDFVRATIRELEQQKKLRAVDTTVATFNVLAMINWVSRWYQPGGRLTITEVAEQIADSALCGLLCATPRRHLRGLRGGA